MMEPKPDAPTLNDANTGQFGPVLEPFTLVNHRGVAVTHESFLGKLMLVYFGFTHCRRVCPRSLTRISETLEKLGTSAADIQAVYITVDPDRDKPEIMREYLEENHPAILGITGDTTELERVKKGFRVFAKRIEDNEDPDGYSMPHTALTYVMDAQGRYRMHFADTVNSDQMAAGLNLIIGESGR